MSWVLSTDRRPPLFIPGTEWDEILQREVVVRKSRVHIVLKWSVRGKRWYQFRAVFERRDTGQYGWRVAGKDSGISPEYWLEIPPDPPAKGNV